MLDGIRGNDGRLGANPVAVARHATTPAARAGSFSLPPVGVPATPPPEVLQALDRVQRVASELHARGLGIHFDRNGDDVKVQVVDSSGGLVREIPVVQALDLLSGERPIGDLSLA